MKPVALTQPDADRTSTALFERERVLQRALDEEYFQRSLEPGRVTYEAGGLDAQSGAFAEVMRLPIAAVGTFPQVHRTARMGALYPRTRPRLTMWYTSPVGSTATFDLRFQLRVYPAGNLTSAIGNRLFNTTFTPAGPAVADTILTTTVVGGAIMSSIPSPIRLTVARIGGDPNVNSLDILLAVITFEEIA